MIQTRRLTTCLFVLLVPQVFACGGATDATDPGPADLTANVTVDAEVVTDVSPDVPPSGPRKLDMLLVVDDSPSMCQEQLNLARSLKAFLAAFQQVVDIDLQVAVTTTNVCPVGNPQGIRGQFVYRPATSLPPGCVEKRTIPCLTDAQCQEWSSNNPGNPLPDAAGWVCEAKPASDQWTCDTTPEVKTAQGADDHYAGDYLFTVATRCRYKCDKDVDPGKCATVFGDPSYTCLYPGGDGTQAGCIVPPATSECPAAPGPTILNSTVADQWLKEWIAGNWAGAADWDPQWKQLPTGDSTIDIAARTTARASVYELLFRCQVTVGAAQILCGNQEQGLRAAWLALDKTGENAAQAAAFLRGDADLLIVVVGDEDDCSAPEYEKTPGVFSNVVPAENFGFCACLRDENGCLPDGTCDATRCLTSGKFDSLKCPLYSTAHLANMLKTLKADPGRVYFATFGGDVLTGTDGKPDATLGLYAANKDVASIRQRYFDCKCDTKAPRTAPFNYVCQSKNGQADLGLRNLTLAQAFGQQGVAMNLCANDPSTLMVELAGTVATKLTTSAK
jgi:hypothetical protein